MMPIIVKINHHRFQNSYSSFSWAKTAQSVLDLHHRSCPKADSGVSGVVWVPAEILNSSYTMQFEKEMEDSHAIECMYSFGM